MSKIRARSYFRFSAVPKSASRVAVEHDLGDFLQIYRRPAADVGTLRILAYGFGLFAFFMAFFDYLGGWTIIGNVTLAIGASLLIIPSIYALISRALRHWSSWVLFSYGLVAFDGLSRPARTLRWTEVEKVEELGKRPIKSTVQFATPPSSRGRTVFAVSHDGTVTKTATEAPRVDAVIYESYREEVYDYYTYLIYPRSGAPIMLSASRIDRVQDLCSHVTEAIAKANPACPGLPSGRAR